MRYFAFLRGINLGGHTVTNVQLIKLFAGAGFPGAAPFIASGNVAFEAKGKGAALEKKIAAHLAKKLGYDVATYVRTRDELARIAALKPFPQARVKSATVWMVGFLHGAATAEQRKTIAGFADDESDFHVEDREIHWLCQTNQSNSKFFRVPFEKRIGALCSWRNRNTVDRLLAKYGA